MTYFPPTDLSNERLWYQKNPAIEALFTKMSEMPLNYQVILADYLNQSMARHQKELQLRPGEEQLKSLGASLVMEMMKYRNQPLWFNRDAKVRQAVMQLPYMQGGVHHELLIRIKLSLEGIDKLVRLCKEQNKRTDDMSVEALVETVFSRSVDDIKQLAQRR